MIKLPDWMPDVTPHLVYPDDKEYVEKATKYWIALNEAWKKSVEEVHAKFVKENFFKDNKDVS
jgi:hypothetical protein